MKFIYCGSILLKYKFIKAYLRMIHIIVQFYYDRRLTSQINRYKPE